METNIRRSVNPEVHTAIFTFAPKHWHNSRRVDISLHSDALCWFLDNLSQLLLLNAAYKAEKQQMPFI
jgi:hypothetical protein